MGCSSSKVVEMNQLDYKYSKPLLSSQGASDKTVATIQNECTTTEKQLINQEEEDQSKKVEIIDETDKQTAAKEIIADPQEEAEEREKNIFQKSEKPTEHNTVLIANENQKEISFVMPYQEQINTSFSGLVISESRNSEKHSSTPSVIDGISLKCGSVCSEILKIDDQKDGFPEIEVNQTIINSSQIIIKVQASRYEAMYPVWVEDSKKITFQVSGEWMVDESLPSATSKGIPTDIENSFSHGALLGRVLGGDYFAVTDGLVYESRTSGPLFLKMHLTNLRVSPKGTLNIKISGGCEKKFSEIEEKIGWNQSQLIPRIKGIGIDNPDIPELEQSTLIFLNKMRTNPILFAQQYLENIRYLTKSTLNLYNYLTTMTQTFQPFSVNTDLINLALECYSSYLEKNTGNQTLSLYSLEEIEKKINSNSQCKEVKLNIKRHEDSKPLSLAIKFILDEKIRNNIFHKDAKHIGLIVKQADKIHSRYNTSVLLFSQEIDQTENSLKLIDKCELSLANKEI